MFNRIFITIIRSVAIPIVSILVLTNTIFGAKNAFLIVIIALSFTNIFSIIWQLVKIFPNLILLKGGKIVGLIITIIIEIISIIAFWIYFFSNFS